jgi:hypothetical protein
MHDQHPDTIRTEVVKRSGGEDISPVTAARKYLNAWNHI